MNDLSAGLARGWVPGLDVSVFQPKIDWAEVYAAGFRWAYVKATESLSYKNPLYAKQFRGARDAGLLVGAYHFAHPEKSAKAQADYFAGVINPLLPGHLPPVLDLEDAYGMKAPHVREWALEFLACVESLTGRWPMLYTGPNFWAAHLDGKKDEKTKDLTSWPLWVAAYTTAPNPPQMAWAKWTAWQYTGKGQIPGVANKVDLNWFNGTERDLRVLAMLGG